MKTTILLAAFVLFVPAGASGQKQLVVVRKDQVMLRLYPGDEIVLRLKGSKRVRISYVNNLIDNAVVVHRDTVPFNMIEKIYFPHSSRLNVIGAMMVFGGGSLLALDQVNHTLIRGNEFGFDRDFTRSTLGVMAAGLPLFLIRKKAEKVGYRTRMLVVGPGSVFYRREPDGFKSPYLDN